MTVLSSYEQATQERRAGEVRARQRIRAAIGQWCQEHRRYEDLCARFFSGRADEAAVEQTERRLDELRPELRRALAAAELSVVERGQELELDDLRHLRFQL